MVRRRGYGVEGGLFGWYSRDVLPGWATSPHPEDDRDDQRIREMTPDERLAELLEILILMESILEGRPDREEELTRRDPLPERWLEIVERARRARTPG